MYISEKCSNSENIGRDLNPENPEISKIIETIFENYKDTEVLKLANLLMRRGRHTLLDNKKGGILNSIFSMHNMAHLGANKDWSEEVRKTIINDYRDWCEETGQTIIRGYRETA